VFYQLLNETSGTNVSSVSITDVFNADFDIYMFTCSQDTAAGNGIYFRLINSAGSVISSNYNYATLQLRSDGAFIENRSTNATYMDSLFQPTADAGNVIYFFNPFSSSSYTFTLGQQSGYYGAAGIPTLVRKGIGVLKETTSCTGFYLQPINGNFTDITVRTYGLRVDS
jgi:hypothetical protein